MMLHIARRRGALGLSVLLAAGVLGGCSSLQQADQQLDTGSHAARRSIDMAKGVGGTSEYIRQINMALSMYKSDNDGKAPATIEEAKKVAHVPDSMWIDAETNKPLVYDPETGTVHRDGAAADSPGIAGEHAGPGSLKVPGGGAGAGGY